MQVKRDKIYRRHGIFAWQYCYSLIGPETSHACETLAQVREIAKRKYGVKASDLVITDV